jgi:hypothetical protein
MMKKYLAISAGLLAGTVMMLTAAPAMARVNVDLNVGLPGVFVPAPVYVQPRPVYVQPRPVYYAPRYHHYKRHHYYSRHDRDGDGVPNRYDRRPTNPYRY